MVIKLIHDGMNHDGLLMDRDDRIRRHADPIVALEGQGLAGHEDDIGAFVAAFHFVLARAGAGAAGGPVRAGGEVQACGFVGAAADVFGADDGVAVCDCEVEQAAPVEGLGGGGVGGGGGRGDTGDEIVDAADGAEEGVAEDGVAEAAGGGVRVVRVVAGAVEAVEEAGEGPFAVGAAFDGEEPARGEGEGERALHVLPGGDAAVVHEHQGAVCEGVAVAVAQGALRCGAHVGEDQSRGRFRGEPREVDAVPGGGGGGEDAGVGAEGGGGVVA